MRKKKPVHAMIDQVRVTRDGDDAIIEYADPEISGTQLTIGPQITTMTDRDIVDVFNGVMAAQERLPLGWNKTVVEIQPGKRQIEYHQESGQWVPRGDVLRCIIDDGGPDGEVTFHIDNEELSLDEFGRLLRVHAGWGMRVAFVSPGAYLSGTNTRRVRRALSAVFKGAAGKDVVSRTGRKVSPYVRGYPAAYRRAASSGSSAR